MLKIGRKEEHRLFVIANKPSSVSAPCSGHTELLSVPLSMLSCFRFRAFCRTVPSAWYVFFCCLVLVNYSGLNLNDASVEKTSLTIHISSHSIHTVFLFCCAFSQHPALFTVYDSLFTCLVIYYCLLPHCKSRDEQFLCGSPLLPQ